MNNNSIMANASNVSFDQYPPRDKIAAIFPAKNPIEVDEHCFDLVQLEFEALNPGLIDLPYFTTGESSNEKEGFMHWDWDGEEHRRFFYGLNHERHRSHSIMNLDSVCENYSIGDTDFDLLFDELQSEPLKIVDEPANSPPTIANKSLKQERVTKSSSKSGQRWTKEEHRQFLRGLQVQGKGAWRLISQQFVPTKKPSQVASHAQKYYKHFAKTIKSGKKKRESIFDITI